MIIDIDPTSSSDSLYFMSSGLKIQKFIWLMVQNFIISSYTYIE